MEEDEEVEVKNGNLTASNIQYNTRGTMINKQMPAMDLAYMLKKSFCVIQICETPRPNLSKGTSSPLHTDFRQM